MGGEAMNRLDGATECAVETFEITISATVSARVERTKDGTFLAIMESQDGSAITVEHDTPGTATTRLREAIGRAALAALDGDTAICKAVKGVRVD